MASFSKPQQQFLGELAAKTGLNPGVLASQLAAEEPVGATQRVGASTVGASNDWLNIGITDSGPMGQANPAWNDPTKAADLSAAWLKGQVSIPGFGKAAPGIVAYANSAGQTPQAQIAALQHSGWASSGYPDLPGLYQTYGNTKLAMPPTAATSAVSTPSAPAAQTTTVNLPTASFDQAGFDKANKQYIAGQFLRGQSSTVWNQNQPKSNVGGTSNPLASLFPSSAPKPADFTTTVNAQSTLQKLAGTTSLGTHPQIAAQNGQKLGNELVGTAQATLQTPGVQQAPHGSLAKVVQLGLRAVQLQQQSHNYHYNNTAGRLNEGRGVLSGHNITFDCSGFVEALYKYAGLGDPAGKTGYAGTSYNISDDGATQKVSASQAVPGDLVVFPNHVALYIGGGQAISMGSEGDPIVISVNNEAAVNNRGLTGYYHLKGLSA